MGLFAYGRPSTNAAYIIPFKQILRYYKKNSGYALLCIRKKPKRRANSGERDSGKGLNTHLRVFSGYSAGILRVF
jgi:hypothetical protein